MTHLSIIDLVTGQQPMRSEDGAVTLVFNGEIYNFRDLRGELQARGRRFATRSDTEVLLRAWEAYGPACVDRLRGMFAFAVWDARRRRRDGRSPGAARGASRPRARRGARRRARAARGGRPPRGIPERRRGLERDRGLHARAERRPPRHLLGGLWRRPLARRAAVRPRRRAAVRDRAPRGSPRAQGGGPGGGGRAVRRRALRRFLGHPDAGR